MNQQITDSITNKISSVKKTIKEDIQNPIKCATDVVTAIPNMIDKVTASVEGFFNRIATAAGNAVDKVTEMTFTDPLIPFKMAIYSVAKQFLGIPGQIVGLTPAQLADPNMKPDKLLEDILIMSAAYKKILDAPKFDIIFNKWLANYAEVIDKTIQKGKPKIDAVGDQVAKIVSDNSKKVGDAITKSLNDLIAAGLKAIPGVGAVVSAAGFAKAFGEKLLAICAPPVSKGGEVALKITNTAVNQFNNAKCKLDELKAKLAPLLKVAQAGGGSGGVNNRKKMHKTTKRVQRLLKRFTRRHKKPTNYGKRLSQLRC